MSGVMYILKYMKFFSMAEARANLAKLISGATKTGERSVITRNGEPAAVLLSIDDYESMNETLEILADPELTAYLLDYQANPDRESNYSLQQVMAEVEARRNGQANRAAI